jgi:flagellar hook-associated protein 3
MRISTGQIQQTMLGSLQSNYSQYGRLQMQMASGKEILQPSDDPIGSVALLGLKKEQKSLSQYQDNISQVQTQLSQDDVQLDSMTEMLQRVQDLTQTAANDTNSTDELKAYAVELRQLQQGLVDLANARDENGSYLFSGSQVDKKPVETDASGNYIYQGDTLSRDVAVAHGVTISANDNASDLFFSSGNFFQQFDTFISSLETATGSVSTEANTMLAQLTSTQSDISSVRSSIGARTNTLDQLDSSHSEMKLFSEDVSNEIESLDYSAAATKMSDVLLALQVTQQSFSKVNSLSLFNYL